MVSGMRVECESPRPNRSAKELSACSPTWATTPVSPSSKITRDALIPFTLEVLSYFTESVVSITQVSRMQGLFRGRKQFRSGGLVNVQG